MRYALILLLFTGCASKPILAEKCEATPQKDVFICKELIK